MAFAWFAEQDVEWAVLEVGLGGRLDATNVIMPAVSVITAISLDHMLILGDTVRQIALEKAGIVKEGVRARPYDVPYRALIARDVGALLLAGRCISGDFVAHSSYRVTGDSVPMGEAAGVAAAVAAGTRRLPQDVPWEEIEKRIRSIGIAPRQRQNSDGPK